MKIAVVGQGYVGLVTAAGAAEWGHAVVGAEVDPRRLATLRAGHSPIHEPGLDELVARHSEAGRLTFTDRAAVAAGDADLVFVAVPTIGAAGEWDLEPMWRCLAAMVPAMPDDAALVIRSTCPPAMVRDIAAAAQKIRADAGCPPLAVLFNPEFTREATALRDFLRPDRVIIGVAHDPQQIGESLLRRFYGDANAPILVLDAVDAMLSKLGANLFLATKISFANELAALCDVYGARIERVVEGMSYDSRIGGSFLRAGIGFGGSCLPDQVSMTVVDAEERGVETPLLAAVGLVNSRQRTMFVDRLEAAVGDLNDRRIALLGLTFKPNTDDLRAAPSLDIATDLIARGAEVVAFDPMPAARERAAMLIPGLQVVDTALSAVSGADAIGLLTEWPECVALPWDVVASLVDGRVIVDGRNAIDPEVVAAAGFEYIGFGRGRLTLEPGRVGVGVMDVEATRLGQAIVVGES